MGRPIRLKMGTDAIGNFYYDTSTSNTSFLQTAKDLHTLGIKDYMFFLKLYNRDLVGVNPYDPNISKGMIKAVITECVINPYYFWREVARIPETGGSVGPGAGSKFILHRANLAAIWCFLHSIDFYEVIPRQCYKTHSVLSMLVWAYIFGLNNSLFTFSCMSEPKAIENLEKLKSHKDVLPAWLQQKYKYITNEVGEIKVDKGINNVKKIKNPINNNTISTTPSANSEAKADTIGRGNSSPIQYYDELEFINYIGTIMQAAGPAYVRSSLIAEKNNAIHCRILTTTPGNIDSEPVISTMKTRDNCACFTEHLYDMSEAEVNEFMKTQSKNNMLYLEYTYQQLGMGPEYFDYMCKVLEWDKIKIKREILLQRIRGSSQSPFDVEDLDIINNNRKPPIAEIMIAKVYILYLYEKIEKSLPYLVGVDLATGAGTDADNTAITITEPTTLKCVACLKTPYADAVENAKLITEVIHKVVPRGLLCIERNSIGSAVISLLSHTPIAGNIYYDRSQVLGEDGIDKLDNKGYIDATPEKRRYWGVTTSSKSRDIMVNQLLTYRVKTHKDSFICRELIDDLNNLIKKASGRIEASSGSHDDVVMSYCFTLYVYEHGVNLSNWGIIKGMQRSGYEKAQKKELTYEEIYESLPDYLKETFPKPENQLVNISAKTIEENTYTDNFNSDFGAMLKEAQNQKRIISTQSGDVVVSTTNNPENAIDENYFDGAPNSDILDICDIINSF